MPAARSESFWGKNQHLINLPRTWSPCSTGKYYWLQKRGIVEYPIKIPAFRIRKYFQIQDRIRGRIRRSFILKFKFFLVLPTNKEIWKGGNCIVVYEEGSPNIWGNARLFCHTYISILANPDTRCILLFLFFLVQRIRSRIKNANTDK